MNNDIELDDLNYNYQINNYNHVNINEDEYKIVDVNKLKKHAYKIYYSGSTIIIEIIKIAPTLYHYYNVYKFMRNFI
jgi:hypothetical protein